MRVLILAPEPPTRGVLHATVSLGVEPVVARSHGQAETDGLVRYERVTARGEAGDAMDLRWSRKALRVLVRDLRPHLIHIVGDPWTPTAETGAAAARDLKLPYVIVGTSSVGGPAGITARWQAKRVRDGAAGLAGTVRPALDHLVGGGTPSIPTAVIPLRGPEIPSRHLPRPDPVTPVFAVVGRLVPERGLELLLDALSEVYGEWRLKIVGTGPSQESLEAKAQVLGLSSRIEWLGGLPREALPDLWPTIDALVAPSRSTPNWVEPTGGIVLDAMAYGIPAVVTRSGALPDVVGEAGLIVDEGDRAALARALQGLVDEPSRAARLGRAARQNVLERYGDGPIAERMVNWWRRVLGE